MNTGSARILFGSERCFVFSGAGKFPVAPRSENPPTMFLGSVYESFTPLVGILAFNREISRGDALFPITANRSSTWQIKGGATTRIASRLLLPFVALLCVMPQAFAQGAPGAGRTRVQASELNAALSLSVPAAPGRVVNTSRREVTRRAMGLEGDYSLDLVTVVAQDSPRFVHYAIRLRFASGTEQSIAITAPPGGLQLEMRDMTGDRVANDLLLTPALPSWAPAVLINDGHDHFTVAIPGGFEGSLGSDRGRLSEPDNASAIAALLSSGFEMSGLTGEREMLIPELQTPFVFASQKTVAKLCPASPQPGRAPPASSVAI
jgi:hypothetical protein